MSVGKSVRLFLADGTPGGLLTAEIMNWTGHIIAAPRSDLANLLKRPETSRTGIYLLLGDDPDSPGGVSAYVGEADDVGTRLKQHARPEDQNGKNFWDRVVVLTSQDSNLTKAHARYLESRFIALARQAQRAHLINGTAPGVISLPEADISAMESFISQATIILPILGVNIFRAATAPTITVNPLPQLDASPTPTKSPTFELRVQRHGIHATAQEIDGEFIVFAGSLVASTWSMSNRGYLPLRKKLEHDGTLQPAEVAPNLYQFTRNTAFSGPSPAGAIVTGRTSNGRNEWKVQATGQTYDQWQTALIDQSPSEDQP